MFSCVKKNKTKALPSVSVGHIIKMLRIKKKIVNYFCTRIHECPIWTGGYIVGFMRSRNAWDNEPHNFQVIHVHVFT